MVLARAKYEEQLEGKLDEELAREKEIGRGLYRRGRNTVAGAKKQMTAAEINAAHKEQGAQGRGRAKSSVK